MSFAMVTYLPNKSGQQNTANLFLLLASSSKERLPHLGLVRPELPSLKPEKNSKKKKKKWKRNSKKKKKKQNVYLF